MPDSRHTASKCHLLSWPVPLLKHMSYDYFWSVLNLTCLWSSTQLHSFAPKGAGRVSDFLVLSLAVIGFDDQLFFLDVNLALHRIVFGHIYCIFVIIFLYPFCNKSCNYTILISNLCRIWWEKINHKFKSIKS